MARVVTAVPVSAGLKASLHAAAGKTIFAGRVRRIGRTAALLAALAAAVGLGLSIYAVSRPTLDLEGLAIENDVNGREDSVKSWLAANHLPATLPRDFNFSLCTNHGLGEIQGQIVPVLLFQDPKDPLGYAKVFIVPAGKFKYGTTDRGGSSFITALKIEGGVQAPGFNFIILYTGDLSRFLRPPPIMN
jgi:hypothetical protein